MAFKLSPRDIEKNSLVYDAMASLGNPDFWFGNHKEKNYEKLVQIEEFTRAPLTGRKCLDIGCGTGDFSSFLRKIEISEYLGLDIYGPSLEFARRKFPHELFLNLDILNWNTEEKFDYVFCSGALSTNIDSDNYKFIESAIAKMWELAGIGLSFNFLTEEMQWTDERIFHYSTTRIIEICKNIINPEGRLFHRIIDGEAHIYIWKSKAI